MRPSTVTRIWVIEDDRTLRRAYEHWLSKTLEDVEIATFPAAEPADEALRAGTRPDALMVDHHLPGERGLDWLLRRQRRLFRARAVLVTGDADEELVARAAFHGIHRVLKPHTPFWLAAYLAGRHDTSVPPAAVRGTTPDAIARLAAEWGLTPRRTEILRLAMDGLRGVEIARALGVRDSTIKTQIHAILRLSGCTDMRDLIAKVLRAQRGG